MPGIVPWIKAADPAKEFLQAYQTSAQIAQANARMAQAAAQADREYALQQQAMQQRQERQQRQDEQDAQQLEVTKAYKEQEMQLSQQKLAQDKEYNDSRIQKAAQGFIRDQNIKKRIAAGEDPVTVYLQEGGSGAGSALREYQTQHRAPATISTSPRGQEYINEGSVAKWGAAPARAPTTDTVTETIPAAEGSPAVPAQPASKGFLGFFAHPDIPAQPAIPSHGDLKRTRHVPVQLDTASGSLMDAYRAKTATGTGSAPAPGQVTTQEQYDALAPGSIYIGKGGKRYRKPGDEKPVQESSHDD